MSTAETIANGLELLGAVGAGAPVVGPWISALAKLGAAIARAGGSPAHITAIDGAALARGRAAADARLDQRAELRDYRVEALRGATPPPVDTEPSPPPRLDDVYDDELSELDVPARRRP